MKKICNCSILLFIFLFVFSTFGVHAESSNIENKKQIDIEMVKTALEALNVDEYGLDNICRKLLEIIIQKFKGGPVGIEALAAALYEDVKTIEEVYEPFLIQKGFLERTSRGRCASLLAYNHLKIQNKNNLSLF